MIFLSDWLDTPLSPLDTFLIICAGFVLSGLALIALGRYLSKKD